MGCFRERRAIGTRIAGTRVVCENASRELIYGSRAQLSGREHPGSELFVSGPHAQQPRDWLRSVDDVTGKQEPAGCSIRAL